MIKSYSWLYVGLMFLTGCSLFHPKMNSKVVQSEPAYCSPANFDENRIIFGDGGELEKLGFNRVYAFRLGKVILAGAGVGNSQAQYLKNLAKALSYRDGWTRQAVNEFLKQIPAPNFPKVEETLSQEQLAQLTHEKYCTWYLNHPRKVPDPLRDAAAASFNHQDILHSPVDLTVAQAGLEFMQHFQVMLDKGPHNFLSCVEQSHYLALGCNEMMHRGPTVFGMLLAFSGCSPEHALEITNQIWSLNDVQRKVRLGVIERAFDWGESHASLRDRFQAVFSLK